MSDNILSTFGKRLSHWLEENVEDQDVALNQLGISYGTLRRLVNDPSGKPKTGLLTRISRGFPTCNIDWLLTGKGEPVWEPIHGAGAPTFERYRKKENERYEIVKLGAELLTDSAKAALLEESKDLLKSINNDNAGILKAILEFRGLTPKG